jgi:hypothetical protein
MVLDVVKSKLEPADCEWRFPSPGAGASLLSLRERNEVRGK